MEIAHTKCTNTHTHIISYGTHSTFRSVPSSKFVPSSTIVWLKKPGLKNQTTKRTKLHNYNNKLSECKRKISRYFVMIRLLWNLFRFCCLLHVLLVLVLVLLFVSQAIQRYLVPFMLFFMFTTPFVWPIVVVAHSMPHSKRVCGNAPNYRYDSVYYSFSRVIGVSCS